MTAAVVNLPGCATVIDRRYSFDYFPSERLTAFK